MTERMTLDEFRDLGGAPKLGAKKKKPNRAADNRRKLELLVLMRRLERDFGLSPEEIVQEYSFAKERGRKYRMDLAIPEQKIALEIHGGAFVRRDTGGTGGAHHTIEGRARDMAKGNLAAVMGWIVIEVSPNEVADGTAYHWLVEALDLRASTERGHMERAKPYLLGAVLFGPPLIVIMILDTPEAAGARAGLLIAAATMATFTGISFIIDAIRKGGQ